MKHLFLFVFSILVLNLNGQNISSVKLSFHCNFKMDEYAQWISTDADVLISNGVLNLNEIEGIQTTIQYTNIQTLNKSYFFIYQEGVRAVVPIQVDGMNRRIITILSKNYMCFEENVIQD